MLGVLLGNLEDVRAADPVCGIKKAKVQLNLEVETKVSNISAQNSKRWLPSFCDLLRGPIKIFFHT